jgi:hypothetical protein
MTEAAENDKGIDRRTMLRRSAMGGAAVWATPAVLTLGQKVAAAATRTFVGCPPGGGGTPPTRLVFRWNGTAVNCTVGGTPDNALERISGDTVTDLGTVDIYVNWANGANYGEAFFPNVTTGSFLTLENNGRGMQNAARFYIFPAGSATTIDEAKALIGTELRYIQVHTSCSQPLVIGDLYCGLELWDGLP